MKFTTMFNAALALVFVGQISETSWITICGSAVTLGTLLISMLRDSRNRREERLERVALAALAVAKAKELQETTERKAEEVKAEGIILGETNIAAIKEIGVKIDDALATPAEVYVKNDSDHPIPTTNTNS